MENRGLRKEEGQGRLAPPPKPNTKTTKRNKKHNTHQKEEGSAADYHQACTRGAEGTAHYHGICTAIMGGTRWFDARCDDTHTAFDEGPGGRLFGHPGKLCPGLGLEWEWGNADRVGVS